MPWETTDAMDQKKQMIEQWQSGRYSKAERSRAPRSQPHKTSPDVVAQIVGLRSHWPHRGAKKLKAIWEREHSRRPCPAASTVAGILRQQGLTVGPQRRRRAAPRSEPLAHAGEPNALWCADFKGWFLAANGERCEPLPLCAAGSRYLLRCQLLSGTSYGQVKPVMEAAFRE